MLTLWRGETQNNGVYNGQGEFLSNLFLQEKLLAMRNVVSILLDIIKKMLKETVKSNDYFCR